MAQQIESNRAKPIDIGVAEELISKNQGGGAGLMVNAELSDADVSRLVEAGVVGMKQLEKGYQNTPQVDLNMAEKYDKLVSRFAHEMEKQGKISDAAKAVAALSSSRDAAVETTKSIMAETAKLVIAQNDGGGLGVLAGQNVSQPEIDVMVSKGVVGMEQIEKGYRNTPYVDENMLGKYDKLVDRVLDTMKERGKIESVAQAKEKLAPARAAAERQTSEIIKKMGELTVPRVEKNGVI